MTVFEVFTLFPEAIEQFVSAGLLGKAIERGLVAVHATSYRDFATDKHRTVDDAPFGGGAGMVVKPEPVVLALEHVHAERGPMHRVLLTPSAPVFDQAAAARLSALPRIALVCGRYEGIDDRIREHYVDECLSIGDFVLGGGEVAALAIIEAVSRLQDGVLGNPDSVAHESFALGARGAWLEHPQYTRPAVFRGHAVPEVLLAGDHAAIARWRRDAARRRTWALRPDLRPAAAEAAAGGPIYLIVASPADVDREAILAVGRRHAVDGIVLLDGDAVLAAWVAAAGGRPPIAALADVRAIRRRLRRASRPPAPPWLVQVVADARGSAREALVASAAELADAHAGPHAASGAAVGALALWLGEVPAGVCDAVWPVLRPGGPPIGPALALPPTIADVSQPAAPLAHLADLALTRLWALRCDRAPGEESPP